MAYCDWALIRPHRTKPCQGGCGTRVDSSDGLCRACRTDAARADAGDQKLQMEREDKDEG